MEHQQTTKTEPALRRAPDRAGATSGIAAAAHPLLALQARVGNQAAARFVQAKLRVGPPGDVYEQEADRVADAVMRMPEGGSIPPVQRQSIRAIQPKCAECEKEEREETESAGLQRAPSTGERGPLNPHEEDDRDEGHSPSPLVRRQPAMEPLAQRQEAEEEIDQQEPATAMAQRQESEEDEGESIQPSLKRKSSSRGVPAVSPRAEASIAGARGGGHALSEASRSFFEPRFGTDFSTVRLHADSTAASTSRELGARAFTVGTDIFFGDGQYRPETASGGTLLAHELTHVVQQGGGTVARSLWTPPAREDGQPAQAREIQGISAVGTLQPYVQRQGGSGSRKPKQASTKSPAMTMEQLKVRQDLHILLDQYQNRILARLDDWLIAAQNVGSAYATAADFHQQAVAERARKRALNEAALFGILTACCTAGLGWLAAAAVEAGIQKLVKLTDEAFENAQDTLVVVVSEGIDVYQAATQPRPQPINKNPLVYQNQLTNKIIRERQRVHQQFDKWLGALLLAPMSSFNDGSRLEQFRKDIDAWTKRSEQLKGGAGLPAVEVMARRLERGFWAEWIPTLASQRLVVNKAGAFRVTDYESPGSDVEKRFNILQITRESGVGDFGIWTSDSEVIQIINWAKSYRPEPFI